MKKEKLSDKQIRAYLFGWLWVEENIMKKVREKVEVKKHGYISKKKKQVNKK